jgi:heterodisulfide reductase subunit B
MGIREKVTWDVGMGKVETVKKYADAMATCCPFCYITYERCQFMTKTNPNLPVVHIPQLLGLAMGLTADDVGLSSNKVDASALLAKQEA